jgi:hypothetical protein
MHNKILASDKWNENSATKSITSFIVQWLIDLYQSQVGVRRIQWQFSVTCIVFVCSSTSFGFYKRQLISPFFSRAWQTEEDCRVGQDGRVLWFCCLQTKLLKQFQTMRWLCPHSEFRCRYFRIFDWIAAHLYELARRCSTSTMETTTSGLQTQSGTIYERKKQSKSSWHCSIKKKKQKKKTFNIVLM